MSARMAGTPKTGAARAAEAAAAYRTADVAAREDEVVRYLPLVKHVAARLAMGLPAHIDLDDLYSYGVFGLLDALKRFDAARGVKFETYAYTRIRGAIVDGLRAADWVPASVRQRAKGVEEAFRRVEARTGRAAEDEEVAAELGLSPEAFTQVMAEIEQGAVLSLDEVFGDEAGDDHTLRDVVEDSGSPDPLQSAEWRDRERLLADAIEQLPERDRTVVTLFYYDGLTPKEISAVLGVTVSRISQLHSRAILRLRAHLAATDAAQ